MTIGEQIEKRPTPVALRLSPDQLREILAPLEARRPR